MGRDYERGREWSRNRKVKIKRNHPLSMCDCVCYRLLVGDPRSLILYYFSLWKERKKIVVWLVPNRLSVTQQRPTVSRLVLLPDEKQSTVTRVCVFIFYPTFSFFFLHSNSVCGSSITDKTQPTPLIILFDL